MEYDEVFDQVGHFGRFQVFCGIVIGLAGVMLGIQVSMFQCLMKYWMALLLNVFSMSDIL